MDNYVFTYSRPEIQALAYGVRTCIDYLTEQDATPFSLFLPEEIYFKDISKYKSDIIRFLPIDYLGFRHCHKDTYVHFTSKNAIQKILRDGYLDRSLAPETGSVGKAIYTYPLNSGLCFSNNSPDGMSLVFEAEAEHCHICQTNDTLMGIGEADFFCDKLPISNPKILDRNELVKLQKECFHWDAAKHAYFGLNCDEPADMDSLYTLLEHYNYDWHPIGTC